MTTAQQPAPDAIPFQAEILALGGSVLLENPDTEKAVTIYMTATAPDEATAAHVFAEIQSYFRMPDYLYLRVPWMPHAATSEAQQQAERKARTTYLALQGRRH